MILLLIIFFLLIKNIKEIKEHKYLFNKFLLERYNYDIKLTKIKRVKGLKLEKMMKEKRHLFYDKKYYTEKEVLDDYYNL